MMHFKRFFLSLLFFLFLEPNSVFTQQEASFEFKRLGVEDGLVNDYVYCVTQDKLGFMWFGTRDGLSRYDGKRIYNYKSDPDDTTSLSGNEILALFSDSKGRLWAAASNGLNRYNFERDRFFRFQPKRGQEEVVKRLKFVSVIREDRSGQLWLGTFADGLFKFNPETGDVAHFPLHKSSTLPPRLHRIYSLHCDRSDTVFVTDNQHQITLINTKSGKVSYFDHNPDRESSKVVLLDRFGAIWLARKNSPLQQLRIDSKHLNVLQTHPEIFPRKGFSDILEDQQGYLWITTTSDGVYWFDKTTGQVINYRYNSNKPSSLASNEVNTVYEDHVGNIWIATIHGVCKWSRWQKPFRHFTHNTDAANSINNAHITGLSTDVQGNLWVASYNDGFSRFEPLTQTFTRFDNLGANVGNVLVEILADDQGTIWLAGSIGEGLYRFDPATSRLKLFKNIPGGTTSLSHNFVRTLYQDHQGRIWVAPYNRGLNLFDPSIDGFKRFEHDPNNSETLSHNNVLCLFQDSELQLWVGTENGLNRYDPVAAIFVRSSLAVAGGQKGTIGEIYAIADDSGSGLWLGTNLGLFSYNPATGSGIIYANTEPSDARVFAILPDATGHLWLQMPGTLARFDQKTDGFRNYDNQDGWIQNVSREDDWLHSSAKLPSGEFVFGGHKGISIFNSENIHDNPHSPPVLVTGFNVLYEPVDLKVGVTGTRARHDSILTRSIFTTEKISLNYSENTFSFEFAALDFSNTDANQYAYILEGFQDNWVTAGNDNVAEFTNVPPGDYTFRVMGSNNDGLWNETGTALRIIIKPPWWRTNPAYFIYTIIIALSLYGFRRFELNRTRIRNELRMKEFEATKLQEVDRMKSRFFANISHEFRTPLTLILGPLADVLARIKDSTLKSDLKVMQRSANRLLRLINQLLDLSSLESGRMQFKAAPGDFSAFLKGIVMSFASLVEQKNIELIFNVGNVGASGQTPLRDNVDPPEIYFDGDKIEKIFYNLLSNALKFTPSPGKVTISVLNAIEFVEVRVVDSGLGIPADKLLHIFDRFYQVDSSTHEGSGIGLALTKELVELHRGEIEVSSLEGQGTTFIVRLPSGKEHLQAENIADTAEVTSIPISEKLELVIEDQHPATSSRDSEDEAMIVLVVDDHPDVRSYIRKHLEKDYNITEAENGEHGVEVAIEIVPDLVISDVMMPKMDGIGLCRALKSNEKTSHIPIILLTAKAGEADKLQGLETGADDYLTKPFNSKELQVRVRNLIEQRRKLREHFRREGLLQPRKIEVTSTEEAFLHKMMAVLEAHLSDENFNIELLSKKLQMGHKQFYRKIRALTGQTPTEFIRSQRLQRAAQLLRQHAGSVSEIAFEVGFNNLSYFARSFKQEFGQLPSDFISKSKSPKT